MGRSRVRTARLQKEYLDAIQDYFGNTMNAKRQLQLPLSNETLWRLARGEYGTPDEVSLLEDTLKSWAIEHSMRGCGALPDPQQPANSPLASSASAADLNLRNKVDKGGKAGRRKIRTHVISEGLRRWMAHWLGSTRNALRFMGLFPLFDSEQCWRIGRGERITQEEYYAIGRAIAQCAVEHNMPLIDPITDEPLLSEDFDVQRGES